MAFEKSARDLEARHRHPEGGGVTARREVLSKRFLHFCFLKVQTFFEKCLANEQMFMGFFTRRGEPNGPGDGTSAPDNPPNPFV